MTDLLRIIQSDCLAALRTLPDESVQMCCTSPPYWGLRDYGVAGQIGLEKTPEEYVARMVEVFREVRRVLRGDGTAWVNLGDSYANDTKWGGTTGGKHVSALHGAAGGLGRGKRNTGLKAKDLCGIPWRVAFALQADGWYLRSDIIWHKPNPMPESVTDRPTKAHEYIFLLSKSANYYYDAEAVKEAVTGDAHMRKANGANSRMVVERAAGREDSNPNPSRSNIPGVTPKSQPAGSGVKANESFHAACVDLVSSRNKRTVWTVPSAPYSEAHFATFPPDLIKPCILAGTSAWGCCPKCGAGWERISEDAPEYAEFKASERTRKNGGMRSSDLGTMGLTRGSSNKSITAQSITTGWRPTCSCGESETIPCTVLDPFAGSGTTGQVALELGRKAILIELNPKYCELILQRCDVTPGLALA